MACEAIVELLDLFADALHGLDLRGRVLPILLQRRDFLRRGVLLRLQRFALRDGAAAVGVERDEALRSTAAPRVCSARR
jgi:hypothetical protein